MVGHAYTAMECPARQLQAIASMRVGAQMEVEQTNGTAVLTCEIASTPVSQISRNPSSAGDLELWGPHVPR